MKELQGTWPGALLDDNRLRLSGWTDVSLHRQQRRPRAAADGLQLPGQRLPPPAELAALRAHRRHQRHQRADLRLPLRHHPARQRLPLHAARAACSTANSPPTTASRNTYGIDPIQFYGEAYFPTVGPRPGREGRPLLRPVRRREQRRRSATPWRRTLTRSSTTRSRTPAS